MSKPQYVYQYVKYKTFIEMIEKKTIRLTDVQFSNDTTELKLVCDVLDSVLLDVFDYTKRKYKYFRDHVSEKEFEEFLEHNTVHIKAIHNIVQTQYASYFSKEEDLLSMWRGYAEDYTATGETKGGIAIKFDARRLEQLSTSSNSSCELRFGEVKYGIRGQKALFRESVENIMREIKKHVKEHKSIHGFNSSGFQIWYHEQVIKQGPFIKNSFFREEREYRLVHWGSESISPFDGNVAGLKLSNDEWRDEYHKAKAKSEEAVRKGKKTGDLPRQYFTIYLADDVNQYIEGITVGPKCYVKIDQIKKHLNDNGVACDVRLSKGLNVYVDSDNHKNE